MGTNAVIPTPGDVIFARRVRAIRNAMGLTLNELSERCGSLGLPLPQSALSKIEHGLRRVSIGEALILLEAMEAEVSLDQAMRDEGIEIRRVVKIGG